MSFLRKMNGACDRVVVIDLIYTMRTCRVNNNLYGREAGFRVGDCGNHLRRTLDEADEVYTLNKTTFV